MSASLNAALYGPDTFEGEANPTPGLDLRMGGQAGFMAAFGGYDKFGRIEEWQSMKPYVKRNVIVKLLTYPKGYDFLPNPDLWKRSLQALLERNLQTLDGLNSKLTVSFGETAMGNTNEVFQTVTNVTRERSSLSGTFIEREGRMVQRFLENNIKILYMDPDLKVPRLTYYLPPEYGESLLQLPEMYTFSFIAIEPDILHRRAVNAWQCLNCMFDNGGENVGRKNQNNEGETLEHSIGITSITLNNEIILAQAQQVLEDMNLGCVEFSSSWVNPVEDIDPQLVDTGVEFEHVGDN